VLPQSTSGWFVSGAAESYEAAVDLEVRRGGRASQRLTARHAAPQGYGVLVQVLPAQPFHGERLRVKAFVKTQGVAGRADVWARVQATEAPTDGCGLSCVWRELPATSEWTLHELELEVPPTGAELQVGLGLGSAGALWIDDVSLEKIPRPAPPATPPLPAELTNADFEAAGEQPSGWELGGEARASAELVVDRQIKHGGAASARLALSARTAGDHAMIAQRVAAEPRRGKRVELSAFVRGSDIRARAGVWVRIEAESSPADGPGLGNVNCELSGTFDWKPCKLVFDVPELAHTVVVGASLAGNGKLWVDDVKLTAVETNIELTPAEIKAPMSFRGLEFPFEVKVAAGKSELQQGDRISVASVRGTQPRLDLGGVYLVSGSYELASHERAVLEVGVSPANPKAIVTEAQQRSGPAPTRVLVGRGRGRFQVAVQLIERGHPHISLYPVEGGVSFGSLYFGQAGWLRRR
jgi:hypothetical protein